MQFSKVEFFLRRERWLSDSSICYAPVHSNIRTIFNMTSDDQRHQKGPELAKFDRHLGYENGLRWTFRQSGTRHFRTFGKWTNRYLRAHIGGTILGTPIAPGIRSSVDENWMSIGLAFASCLGIVARRSPIVLLDQYIEATLLRFVYEVISGFLFRAVHAPIVTSTARLQHDHRSDWTPLEFWVLHWIALVKRSVRISNVGALLHFCCNSTLHQAAPDTAVHDQ